MKITMECTNASCKDFQKPKKLEKSLCFCTSCGGKLIHACRKCHAELDDPNRIYCSACEEEYKNLSSEEKSRRFVSEVLDACYEKCLEGIPNVSPSVEEMANDYLKKYKTKDEACKAMLRNQIVKCTTSGFLTGFGGIITLPVALPANITSVLYVQMRMISCVAYMNDYAVNSDQTQTFVYACLAGVSVNQLIKQVSVKLGTKLATSVVKRIPGKVLVKINQKVGFRFITKFGTTGVINLGKMVPGVGAVIGGGLDLTETKIIADRAFRWFAEGDFSDRKDKDSSHNDEEEIILNEEDFDESGEENNSDT